MKNKRNSILFTVLFIVGIGLYNLCVFVLADEYTNKFWVAYAFTTVAFFSQIITSIAIKADSDVKKDNYLGLPLLMQSSIYFVVQLIAGIVFMLAPLSFELTLVIEAIIFACFVMIAIFVSMGKRSIASSDNQIKDSALFIKNLTVRAETVYNDTVDSAQKAELKKMYEVIRYSDPISNSDEISSINQQIDVAFIAACDNISIKSFDNLSRDVKTVTDLVNRRNAVCKAGKK